MDEPSFNDFNVVQAHKTALKNIIQNFTFTVQNLYSLHSIQLPLKKSQIFQKVFQLFESQFDLEQSSQSQCFHPFKLIEEDTQNIKQLNQHLNSQIKSPTLFRLDNKLQDKDASQSRKNSKRLISVNDPQCTSMSEINLLQNNDNQISQQGCKTVQLKKNPYAVMNEDIDINQTYFVNSKQITSSEQFIVEQQIEQCCNIASKIQSEEEQQSFNIQEYQNQSSKEELLALERQKTKKSIIKIKNYQNQSQNFQFQQKKHYRSYTQQQKKQTLIKVQQFGIQFTSKIEKIPKKNIVRWIKKAQQNNFQRGRKPINPFMQVQLTKWIKNNIKNHIYVTQSDIRCKARQLSGQINFKASKGWLQKYFRRNKTIGQQLSRLLILKRAQKGISSTKIQ